MKDYAIVMVWGKLVREWELGAVGRNPDSIELYHKIQNLN